MGLSFCVFSNNKSTAQIYQFLLIADDQEKLACQSILQGKGSATEFNAPQYLRKLSLSSETLLLSLHSAIDKGVLLRQVADLKVQNEQHQHVLNQKEELLSLALASAQMGIWDWDLLAGNTIWNREHEQLFGLSPGSFDGTYETLDRCIHPEDRATFHECVIKSIETHATLCHQFRIVWGDDGSTHWIETRGKAYFDEAGQPVRMIGTVANINEQQQAQQLLQNQLNLQRLVLDLTVRARQSLDLQEILQTTVDEMRQFLQIERVLIYQFAPD
jgi:PAS domain S-box-containing protein